MQYLGGKNRISKKIVAYLESVRQPNQVYFEPFVGAANVICKMGGKRIGSDNHEDLIMLLKAVRDRTIEFPESVTQEDYYKIKSMPPSPLRGFVGFGCSFAGRWFMGFARSGSRNYCLNAKNSLLKKQNGLEGVELLHSEYKEFDPSNWLIYCDPPYANTTHYPGSTKTEKFDHVEFWEIMRKWSENNTVVISEYSSPSDFECVLEIPTKTDLRLKSQIKDVRVEKLFRKK